MVLLEFREPLEQMACKVQLVLLEYKVSKAMLEPQEPKGLPEQMEVKDIKGVLEMQGIKAVKDIKGQVKLAHKVIRETRVIQALKARCQSAHRALKGYKVSPVERKGSKEA